MVENSIYNPLFEVNDFDSIIYIGEELEYLGTIDYYINTIPVYKLPELPRFINAKYKTSYTTINSINYYSNTVRSINAINNRFFKNTKSDYCFDNFKLENRRFLVNKGILIEYDITRSLTVLACVYAIPERVYIEGVEFIDTSKYKIGVYIDKSLYEDTMLKSLFNKLRIMISKHTFRGTIPIIEVRNDLQFNIIHDSPNPQSPYMDVYNELSKIVIPYEQ